MIGRSPNFKFPGWKLQMASLARMPPSWRCRPGRPCRAAGRRAPAPARSSRATSARSTTAASSILASTQTEQGDWREAAGMDHGAGRDRPGPDGLPRLGRGPQLRPLQQPRPQGPAEHHLGPGRHHRHHRPGGMYHHGFGMLALAEAYGAVDERNLWPDPKAQNRRSIGQALELAVRAAITSQKKNSAGRLAIHAGLHRRRHLGQRRGPHGPARGPERRDRGPRRGGRPGHRLLQEHDLPSGQVAYSGIGGFGESTARSLDRHARPRDRPPQGPARIQGHPRLPHRQARPARRRITSNTPATTRPRPSSRGTSPPGRGGTRC